MAAEKHEVPDEVALSLLDEEAWSLHKELRSVDFQIGGHIHAHAEGYYDADQTMARLRELYDAKADLMYKVGRLSVLREQVEERMQAPESTEREPAQQGPQPEMASGPDDYLDWMHLTPEETETREQPDRHPRLDGEERMLDEMERDAADDRDWWQRLER